MARNLTKKEKGFVEDIAKGANGTEAALKNYDTEDYMTAANIASENLKKPKIIQALEEALPDEMLNDIHKEGLYATKPIYVEGKKVDEDADFLTRAKYLDMAYKRKGSYAAEKHVNLNVEVGTSDRIKELAYRLKNASHGQVSISTGESVPEGSVPRE